jgi:alanine racemase
MSGVRGSERSTAALAGRVAPPRAECSIDLGAVRHNVRSLAGRLAHGSQFWAVVKANAYGHDVDRVAEVAIAAGARRLCVATLSEARQLRQAGIRVPLLIMGPLDAGGLARAADLEVSTAILNAGMVTSLADAAAPHRPVRAHLKVDTGMGRWGVPADEVASALDALLAIEGVELEGVMTHFATADDAGDGGFFDRQLATFKDVVALVRDRVPGVTAHAANSAATLRTPDAHFDAVRCGVATYGLSPTQADAAADDLRPAMSLRSYVADVRHRDPGESVGYCRTFVADKPSLVALVPTGYADGVRRALSNTGEAVVNGRRWPYVGNVSMDHLSLLVDEGVRVGDVVTLLGCDGEASVSAEEHAAWSGTINYEITCAMAGEPRLLRRYTQDL